MTHIRVFSLLFAICMVACEKPGITVFEEPIPVELIYEKVDEESIPKYSITLLYPLSELGADSFENSSQGMDIYKDRFLFQAGLPGGLIYVVDLETRSFLGRIAFTAPRNESSHMNNINCGNKFNNTDRFPLLYVSQTSNTHQCFVIRLDNHLSSYELVQTIQYIGEKHHMGSNYDWFIDLDRSIICTYGKRNGLIDEREIVEFPMPSIEEKQIVFTDDDVIDSFVLKNMSIYQGSRIINGLLYAPVGYGNSEYPGRLKIISLEEKSLLYDISLNCGEPESIGRYKNGAIICGGGGNPNYYFINL